MVRATESPFSRSEVKMAWNQSVRVGLASLLVTISCTAHAEVGPKAGDQCDRQQWGQNTSFFIQPMLTCVHGAWKESSKLRSITVVVNANDKNGAPVMSYFQNVREGTWARIGRWNEQGVPVRGNDGSLTSVMTKLGDWGTLMPTFTSNGSGVLLEGAFDHADTQASWQQPVSVIVPFSQEITVAIRPDGVSYKIEVIETPN